MVDSFVVIIICGDDAIFLAPIVYNNTIIYLNILRQSSVSIFDISGTNRYIHLLTSLIFTCDRLTALTFLTSNRLNVMVVSLIFLTCNCYGGPL